MLTVQALCYLQTRNWLGEAALVTASEGWSQDLNPGLPRPGVLPTPMPLTWPVIYEPPSAYPAFRAVKELSPFKCKYVTRRDSDKG